MKKYFILGIFFLAIIPAHAGALFLDYLNYVRPGTGTGPGTTKVTVTSSQPVGQSFTVPANTGEIYRIAVRPIYDTWGPEEQVTMTLYNSQDRKEKLGEYVIEYETCHIQGAGDRTSGRSGNDKILFFQFRRKCGNQDKFYFELSTNGSVDFSAFDMDIYTSGEIAPLSDSVKDLSFECNIKPAINPEESLRSFFTERIDLSRPEFAAVKSAVDSKNWETAIAETVKVFDSRVDIWDKVKQAHQNLPPPGVRVPDTDVADLILKGSLQNRAIGRPVKWRKENYWAPAYVDTESAHALYPNIYRFDIDTLLLRTYLITKNQEYARKAVDLRIQFILDNPDPILTDCPLYFEVWNDRTAAARAPGEGVLIYAQLLGLQNWTNDEKLVFLSFLEDNARYISRSTSWGNWGSTAAEAAFKFAAMFPEWKMSAEYFNAGVDKLIGMSYGDVSSDGTTTEAAVGYASIVARSFVKLLNDHKLGLIKLEESQIEQITKTVLNAYEHFMYVTQPNGLMVMYGDSGCEEILSELRTLGTALNRPDFTWVATKGQAGTKPTDISKTFPMGGYYIMRSDFGGDDLEYADARHLFVHNGFWFGQHGHFDLTAINLYGYGRTLLVDPGHCGYMASPANEDYWQSRIHSMMLRDDNDIRRRSGSTNKWASNNTIDWLDATHRGYREYARRRIAFIKPDYFLVDDSANTTSNTTWTQAWNIADKNAKVDTDTKTIETTYTSGGNLIIMNQDPARLTIRETPGIAASNMDRNVPTKIVRLDYVTDNPRFSSLLYPYKAGERPTLGWERIMPDSRLSDLFYSVRVNNNKDIDWAVFGQAGTSVPYRSGKHQVDADFALVRLDQGGNAKSFSWVRGSELTFSGKNLAKSDAMMHSLAVKYEDNKLIVDAPEPDASLAIWINNATTFELNGKAISNPAIKNTMYYPFGDQKLTIVADDETRFEKLTETEEWGGIACEHSWSGGLTHHEGDIGRCESGNYIFNVPEAGDYGVEVFLGNIPMVLSEKTEYSISAKNGTPAGNGGAVVGQRRDGSSYVVTVDHRAKCGWVKLGEYTFEKGRIKINAKNVSDVDCAYFVADAMRLVKK